MCKLCNHSFLHYHNYQRISSIPCIYISNIPKGVSDTDTEIALKNKLCKSIFPVLTEYVLYSVNGSQNVLGWGVWELWNSFKIIKQNLAEVKIEFMES